MPNGTLSHSTAITYYIYISVKPLIFAFSAPLNLLLCIYAFFPFLFARHHTKNLSVGLFFYSRSHSVFFIRWYCFGFGLIFFLSLCVGSFEIIVRFIMSSFVFIYLCFFRFYFVHSPHSIILYICFSYSRFPLFVIHIFDGFSHSKQHHTQQQHSTATSSIVGGF